MGPEVVVFVLSKLASTVTNVVTWCPKQQTPPQLVLERCVQAQAAQSQTGWRRGWTRRRLQRTETDQLEASLRSFDEHSLA